MSTSYPNHQFLLQGTQGIKPSIDINADDVGSYSAEYLRNFNTIYMVFFVGYLQRHHVYCVAIMYLKSPGRDPH